MKNLILISVFTLSNIVIFAQEFTKTTRNVSDFNSIRLECTADIIITQGDKLSVIVETEEKNQADVKTIVKANTLVVDIDARIFKTKRLNIYITLKDLSQITNEGSGDFEFKTPLKTANFLYTGNGSGDFEIAKITTNKFIAKMNGSGDCEIAGDIKEIYAELNGSGDFEAENINLINCNIIINGSGDVELKGMSKNIKIKQTGSGDFEGEKFSVLNAIIVKTGSGDADLNVKNDINLTSIGSGSFNLKGNPPKRQISVTGSGSFNE